MPTKVVAQRCHHSGCDLAKSSGTMFYATSILIDKPIRQGSPMRGAGHQWNAIYNFSSNKALVTPAKGQARIEAFDDPSKSPASANFMGRNSSSEQALNDLGHIRIRQIHNFRTGNLW